MRGQGGAMIVVVIAVGAEGAEGGGAGGGGGAGRGLLQAGSEVRW